MKKKYNASLSTNIDHVGIPCLRTTSTPCGDHIVASLQLVDPNDLAEYVLEHWDSLDPDIKNRFKEIFE
mgnify:CR=1 FL=1